MKLNKAHIATITEQFKVLAEKHQFFGNASLYLNHEPLIDLSFGYRDLEQNIPFTKETKISVAQVNILFATILILKLEAQKKLKLTDRLDKYIPEYKHADQITIKHLLRFESQIPSYVTSHLMLDVMKDVSYEHLSEIDKKRIYVNKATKNYAFDDVLSFINGHELLKKPGGSPEFQNDTVLVFLKRLIEKASQMSYQSFLEKEIFDIANIKPSYLQKSDAKHYEQTDDDYHFEVTLNDDPIPMVLLDTNQIHDLVFSITSKKVISEAIWKKMKQFKDKIGLGIFEGLGNIELGFDYVSHYMSTYYYEDLNMNFIISSNYCGNWYMESGKWKAFVFEAKKLIAPLYMYPTNPKIEKYSKKNRYDFISIEISEAQQKYVPDIYKCLAYTYQDKKCHQYVLKDQGLSVGMFTLSIDHKYQEYYVRFLMIDQKYQNRGYGKIMLKEAVRILKEKGAKTLEIGLVSENIAALKMYQSVGFEIFNRGQNYIHLKIELSD